MLLRKNHIFSTLSVIILAVTFLYSCSPVDLDLDPTPSPGRSAESEIIRIPGKEYRNVFIMYSMGFNDLRAFLTSDIKDITSSPLSDNGKDIVLILSQIAQPHPEKRFNPDIPVCPTLTMLSKNFDGSIKVDTLTVADEHFKLDQSTVLGSAETLKKFLEYIQAKFSAERYGILLSSHGSGWAPSGYISAPDAFEPIPIGIDAPDRNPAPKKRIFPVYRPYIEEDIPVKSIGAHNVTFDTALEIDITDLSEAFPFKMSYIILDACFMGGVEVAYQLRNAADKILFSQTEILAEGMNYKKIASQLFAEDGPDLEGVCQSFYNQYSGYSGVYKSATISLIDCTRLESLAQTTKQMLEKYRSGLDRLQQTRNVQQYYRNEYEKKHKWYYDFGDIIEKCGLSEEDKETFNKSLTDIVKFKAATQWFMSDFEIKKHSGLSMYLPFTTDREYLNSFYKTLEWNKAVGLIQ